jgi:hypothetical protein
MLILNNTYNGDFSSFLESCYCKDDNVYYDAFRYQLLDKISVNKLDFNQFNEFEMDSIFKTLLFEIKKKTSCIDEAMTLSPTFRLYVSYIEYKKKSTIAVFLNTFEVLHCSLMKEIMRLATLLKL